MCIRDRSREVTSAMANTACRNLMDSLDLITTYSEKGFQLIQELETTVDLSLIHI